MASRGSLRWLATAGMVAASLVLAGCSSFGPPTSGACIDWVYFESPADAADEADAVIVGTVESSAGSTTYLDLPATKWHVSVDRWIKGGDGSRTVVVTSLPRSCGDTHDSVADAVDAGPVVLFLRDGKSGWETLTPFQGLIPAERDGNLPSEWPADKDD